MGMEFAPTWLCQVTPPPSYDHFNRWSFWNKWWWWWWWRSWWSI